MTLAVAVAAEELIVQVAAVAAVDIMGAPTQEALEALARAAQLTHQCAQAAQVRPSMEH